MCAAAHCVLVIPVTPPHIVSVRLAPTLSVSVTPPSTVSLHVLVIPVTPLHIDLGLTATQ